jgi:hypothetical protein
LGVWTWYITWLLAAVKGQAAMDVMGMTGELLTETSHITTVLVSDLTRHATRRPLEYAKCAIKLGLTEATRESDSSRVLELFTNQIKKDFSTIYGESTAEITRSIATKRDELVASITPESVKTVQKRLELIWDKMEQISRERSPKNTGIRQIEMPPDASLGRSVVQVVDKSVQKLSISPIYQGTIEDNEVDADLSEYTIREEPQGMAKFACKFGLNFDECGSVVKIKTFNQALNIGCPGVYDDWKKIKDNARLEIKARSKTIVEKYRDELGDTARLYKGYVDDSCDVTMPIVSVLLLFIVLLISYIKYAKRTSRVISSPRSQITEGAGSRRIKRLRDSGRHSYRKTRKSSTKRKSGKRKSRSGRKSKRSLKSSTKRKSGKRKSRSVRKSKRSRKSSTKRKSRSVRKSKRSRKSSTKRKSRSVRKSKRSRKPLKR